MSEAKTQSDDSKGLQSSRSSHHPVQIPPNRLDLLGRFNPACIQLVDRDAEPNCSIGDPGLESPNDHVTQH